MFMVAIAQLCLAKLNKMAILKGSEVVLGAFLYALNFM